MRILDIPHIHTILGDAGIDKRLQKRLNVAIINSVDPANWINFELFNLPTKDGAAGVLLVGLNDHIYALAYEINPIGDRLTGRTKPVICDFCKTWQPGGRAGMVTFRISRRSLNSISYLCCLDLGCSLHVRDISKSSRTSRSQLREDISTEYRIDRLQRKLAIVIERLGLAPLSNLIGVKNE